MVKIAVIVGSTRPGRKAQDVARWVMEIASLRSDAIYELVDIRDFLQTTTVPGAVGNHDASCPALPDPTPRAGGDPC